MQCLRTDLSLGGDVGIAAGKGGLAVLFTPTHSLEHCLNHWVAVALVTRHQEDCICHLHWKSRLHKAGKYLSTTGPSSKLHHLAGLQTRQAAVIEHGQESFWKALAKVCTNSVGAGSHHSSSGRDLHGHNPVPVCKVRGAGI